MSRNRLHVGDCMPAVGFNHNIVSQAVLCGMQFLKVIEACKKNQGKQTVCRLCCWFRGIKYVPYS